MKRYILDTNVILRLFLSDNQEQSTKTKKYFEDAKRGKIQLVLLVEVVCEVEYVLEKVYLTPENIRRNLILTLINSSFINFPHAEEKMILNQAFSFEGSKDLSLVDKILYFYAKAYDASVLTFDKKLAKMG